MIIGIDNVDIELCDNMVDLSEHVPDDEKYVYAVDYRVDMIITIDKETAEYFKENGIPAYLEI